MSQDFRAALQREIAELEAKLSALRVSLKTYDLASTQAADAVGAKTTRFAGMRPTWRAVETVLKDNGGKMPREALMEALVEGGATIGKKRGLHNLRISIDENLKLGKLAAQGKELKLTGR